MHCSRRQADPKFLLRLLLMQMVMNIPQSLILESQKKKLL